MFLAPIAACILAFTPTPTMPPTYTFQADPAEVILLPIGYTLETTPMVAVEGPIDEHGHRGTIVIPEESPEGGYHIGGWLDNSPTYTGVKSAWMLQVNDTSNTVQWVSIPTDEQLGA